VRSWWGSTFEEATVPVRVLILNERASPFGAGWSLLGLQRIYAQPDGSVVIAEGDGSVAYFRRTSCPTPSTCTYASPAGDFSTLTGGNGNYYLRRYPDGMTLTFLPDGRLRWVEDRFDNTTSYNWLNATQLGSIQDATGVAGHGFYVYHDAAGKLREIRAFSRSSHFTVDAAGNLTHIQDPDGLYALQATYDANHRLEHRTDRRGGAWGFAYDFAGKLAADTMPQITADGQSVRPVVRLRSAESATLADPALGYGSFSNPAPRVRPDSVRAELTNPRGFTTRFALNRFGAPTRIEEPLGRTTQFTYNAHSPGDPNHLALRPHGGLHLVRPQPDPDA
jgi:YD repeat-containing protein